jgi:hypothetical protein
MHSRGAENTGSERAMKANANKGVKNRMDKMSSLEGSNAFVGV